MPLKNFRLAFSLTANITNGLFILGIRRLFSKIRKNVLVINFINNNNNYYYYYIAACRPVNR
jgi:hypothetical protein